MSCTASLAWDQDGERVHDFRKLPLRDGQRFDVNWAGLYVYDEPNPQARVEPKVVLEDGELRYGKIRAVVRKYGTGARCGAIWHGEPYLEEPLKGYVFITEEQGDDAYGGINADVLVWAHRRLCGQSKRLYVGHTQDAHHLFDEWTETIPAALRFAVALGLGHELRDIGTKTSAAAVDLVEQNDELLEQQAAIRRALDCRDDAPMSDVMNRAARLATLFDAVKGLIPLTQDEEKKR
jgi:hypothetical protein